MIYYSYVYKNYNYRFNLRFKNLDHIGTSGEDCPALKLNTSTSILEPNRLFPDNYNHGEIYTNYIEKNLNFVLFQIYNFINVFIINNNNNNVILLILD